jgi:hypothetical protein
MFPESSLTFKVPDIVPAAGGVNVTATAQLDAGASTKGQLFVWKNPALADRLNKFSGLPPKLEIVMLCAGLVVPAFCEKVNVEGEKPMAEGRGLGSRRGVAPKT